MSLVLDLAIVNGSVIDGTGAEPYRATVGVAEGRIRVIDPHESPEARKTVDATGRVIAPGFIDLHSHADFSICQNPQAITQLAQGVTTLVTGNCGFSPFPVVDREAMQEMTGFLGGGTMEFDWTDLASFASRVDEAGPAVNIAPQVGHNSLRVAAFGLERRPPEPPEARRMAELLTTAAEQGAFGFSTGLIYAPGTFAEPDEVKNLAGAAARCGLLYSTHMRNETSTVLDAVDEALEAAAASGVRLEISHLKSMGPENHGLVRPALDRIRQAQLQGVDVACDVYPYTASSTTLTSRMPAWAMDGGPTALLHRLQVEETRHRIAAELAARFGHDIDPDGLVIAELPQNRPSRYSWAIGSSIVDIGQRDSCSPQEAALRVLEDNDARVAIVNHSMAEEDVTTVLTAPFTSVASDGWTLEASGPGTPHPRSFGTFARVLGRYTRDRQALSLPDAIRRMTALPASRIGLTDRGRVSDGLVADLAIFDPNTVIDHSTYRQPWQLATGVDTVIIDGHVAFENGRASASRWGRVLRHRRRQVHRTRPADVRASSGQTALGNIPGDL